MEPLKSEGGNVMEQTIDTKANLCDMCWCRELFPNCMPDKGYIEFGNALGNDNIIRCVNYVRLSQKEEV